MQYSGEYIKMMYGIPIPLGWSMSVNLNKHLLLEIK